MNSDTVPMELRCKGERWGTGRKTSSEYSYMYNVIYVYIFGVQANFIGAY